MSVITAKLC